MKYLLLVVALVFTSNGMASTGDIEVAKKGCETKKVIHKPKAKAKKIKHSKIPASSFSEPVVVAKEEPCQLIFRQYEVVQVLAAPYTRVTPYPLSNVLRPQQSSPSLGSAVPAPAGFVGVVPTFQYAYLTTHTIEYKYLPTQIHTVHNPIPIATPLPSAFWLLATGLVLFIRKLL